MTGLAVAIGGWAAFALAAAGAVLTRHALDVRSEAVARACHEVRGPLAAARLGLELTVSNPAASASRLRAIDVELRRAALALDDLEGVDQLVWAPTTGELLVDVEAWLRDSVEAWQPAAEAGGAGIRLVWRGHEACVWGQQARLAQVTGNLIANAIEHGGGLVEVRGRAEGGVVRIEVTDDGPGLPGAVAERLRDGGPAPGGRRLRRGRAADGTWGRGRGLGIAASVAAAHGGRLAAAPSPSGGGARLVLELPVAEGTGRWRRAVAGGRG